MKKIITILVLLSSINVFAAGRIDMSLDMESNGYEIDDVIVSVADIDLPGELKFTILIEYANGHSHVSSNVVDKDGKIIRFDYSDATKLSEDLMKTFRPKNILCVPKNKKERYNPDCHIASLRRK